MYKLLDDYFEYFSLHREFSGDEINRNIISLQNEFASITKTWSMQLNSEWVLRDYIAIKMILSSTVLLGSVKYANEKNLKIVEPYLIYYSLLNCARCVILTSPYYRWNSGDILTMTHKKTINIVGDIISKYNKEKGQEIKKFIDNAREYREIFSYKFPAKGLTNHNLNLENTILICQILCEISQLQSKVLENSYDKNTKEKYDVDWEMMDFGYSYGEINFNFIDKEDAFRLYLIAKEQKRPYSLASTMTEGMVMDFFEACYDSENEIEENFDPDKYEDIIFPCP
jgi:hypothetical protein